MKKGVMGLMARLNDWTGPRDIDTWWIQILFWRSHLDTFIMNVLGVQLKDTQRVIARAIGNGVYSDIVKSRGKCLIRIWEKLAGSNLPLCDCCIVS